MNTWPGGRPRAIRQREHDNWNARNHPGTRQLCSACGTETGRCEEDSLCAASGEPLCEECFGCDAYAERVGHERAERAEGEAEKLRAALAEIEQLKAQLAAVIEDRARFPDRPDGVGRMIEAHIGNLKAARKAAEDHARRCRERAERAERREERLRDILSDIVEQYDLCRRQHCYTPAPVVHPIERGRKELEEGNE